MRRCLQKELRTYLLTRMSWMFEAVHLFTSTYIQSSHSWNTLYSRRKTNEHRVCQSCVELEQWKLFHWKCGINRSKKKKLFFRSLYTPEIVSFFSNWCCLTLSNESCLIWKELSFFPFRSLLIETLFSSHFNEMSELCGSEFHIYFHIYFSWYYQYGTIVDEILTISSNSYQNNYNWVLYFSCWSYVLHLLRILWVSHYSGHKSKSFRQ